MKVKASLKLICPDCYFVRRGKTLFMRCKTSPRHKRRQGFSTLNRLPASEVPASELLDNFSLNRLPAQPCEEQASCSNCNKPMGPLALHEVYAIQQKFANNIPIIDEAEEEAMIDEEIKL